MTELEAAYATQDSEYQSKREQLAKRHGVDSAFVSALDTRYKLDLAGRLPAQKTALAISEQMDKAFKNYLDGGIFCPTTRGRSKSRVSPARMRLISCTR